MTEAEPHKEQKNTRLRLVQPILLKAVKRSQELGKIMVDPIDILTHLIEDPDVAHTLIEAEIDVSQLQEEMRLVDRDVIHGGSAIFPEEQRQDDPEIYRSFVLEESIAIAGELAKTEGQADVTGLHLLAGMLRQGFNTGASVFMHLDLTQRQIDILARFNHQEVL